MVDSSRRNCATLRESVGGLEFVVASENYQLDREKLKEVVLFIASRCPPEELGNVKLHKALYYSDMLHFLQEGRPLTGVDYLKQKFGPVARHLTATLNALASEGRLKIEEEEHFGLFKKSYVPLAAYVPKHLNDEERALIAEVVDFVRGKSAKEISDISHNAAWEMMELGEVIPYFTALRLVPDEVTEADRDWAVSTALEHATEPLPQPV